MFNTREDATERIVESGLFDELETEMNRLLLMHETGYYWAMSILYDKKDPQWHLRPELWPPPNDYYEWVVKEAAGMNRE